LPHARRSDDERRVDEGQGAAEAVVWRRARAPDDTPLPGVVLVEEHAPGIAGVGGRGSDRELVLGVGDRESELVPVLRDLSGLGGIEDIPKRAALEEIHLSDARLLRCAHEQLAPSAGQGRSEIAPAERLRLGEYRLRDLRIHVEEVHGPGFWYGRPCSSDHAGTRRSDGDAAIVEDRGRGAEVVTHYVAGILQHLQQLAVTGRRWRPLEADHEHRARGLARRGI